MDNKNLVSVKNFRMSFGPKTVIEDLSFDVGEGEVFGFLGANGSGKTTTLRALLGIYEPTAGKLLIKGRKFNPEMSSFLGYLPEERGLYKKEKVLDVMVYFGQLKGLTRAEAKSWSEKYLVRVDLVDKINDRLSNLSGGQQQKIQLGVTIINSPKLLILDEPTKGLDPVNRRLMLEIIRERVTDGATVILVTHQMEEVERLCNRVLLLKDGLRRLYGQVDEIRREYGSKLISLGFSGKLAPEENYFTISQQDANTAELSPKDGVSQQQILNVLTKQSDLQINKFEVHQASLDDIFVQIYEEDKQHA